MPYCMTLITPQNLYHTSYNAPKKLYHTSDITILRTLSCLPVGSDGASRQLPFAIIHLVNKHEVIKEMHRISKNPGEKTKETIANQLQDLGNIIMKRNEQASRFPKTRPSQENQSDEGEILSLV